MPFDIEKFDDEFDDQPGRTDGPHDLRYCREKLLLTVLSLSSDDRNFRQRIFGAFHHVGSLTAADFPADLRGDFLDVRAWVPEGKSIVDSLAQLDEKRLRAIISKLIFLSDAVSARAAQSLQSATVFGLR